ncbi:BCCT family transporter, partial [Vibrio campbellii]
FSIDAIIADQNESAYFSRYLHDSSMLVVGSPQDSMTYTISVVVSGETEPNAIIRTFWGVAMGVVALILISLGSGGISALQSFIVITAVPVSLILLPSLWNAPQIAIKMAKEQGL